MRNRIYIVLKYLPTKMLINYKGQMSKFTVERPGRHHLNQVVKANTINNATNWNHMPPDRLQRGQSDTPVKEAECQSHCEEISRQIQTGRCCETNGRWPSECQCPEVQGRLGNCPRPRERRAGQPKAAGGSGSASATEMLLQRLEKPEQGLRIRWYDTSVLLSWLRWCFEEFPCYRNTL